MFVKMTEKNNSNSYAKNRVVFFCLWEIVVKKLLPSFFGQFNRNAIFESTIPVALINFIARSYSYVYLVRDL